MHFMFRGNAWLSCNEKTFFLHFFSFFCFCNATFFHSSYVIKPPQPSSAIYGALPFTSNLSVGQYCCFFVQCECAAVTSVAEHLFIVRCNVCLLLHFIWLMAARVVICYELSDSNEALAFPHIIDGFNSYLFLLKRHGVDYRKLQAGRISLKIYTWWNVKCTEPHGVTVLA